jgi:methionyl-tRNA formyltransferase
MRKTEEKFLGPLRGLVLLGGGLLLREMCAWAHNRNFMVKVITSPRHAKELVENERLDNFLEKNKVETIITEKIDTDEVKRFLRSANEHLFLSLGAAWIFSEDVVEKLFSNTLLDLHGARLPKHRGGGGPSWKILMGDRLDNCLIHLIDGGVDTGGIIDYAEFIYPPSARKPVDYEAVALRKNFEFLTAFIEKHSYEPRKIFPIPQPEYLSSYWPRLNTDSNGWINWSWSGPDLERFICAFDDPYPGAQTFLGTRKVRLKSAILSVSEERFHPFQSGLVYRSNAEWCCIAVCEGTIIVEEVVDDEGHNLVGKLRVGDRFSTPHKKLEDALGRPVYTPNGLKR